MLRWLSVAVAFCAIGVAVALAPPASGIPLRDFEAYYSAGAAWNAGVDPYGRSIWNFERSIPGVVTTRDEVLPFVSPPYTLPFFGALARLPYETARIVWWCVLTASGITLIGGSLWLAVGARRPLDLLAVAALGFAFGPIESGFALGQLALVSCAAMVATVFVARRSSIAAAACAFAAALQPNVALPLVALARESKARLAIAIAAAGALAILFSAGGAGALTRYAAVLQAHAVAERCAATQMSVASTACGFGAPVWLANTFAIGIFLIAGVVCLYAVLSARYDWTARVAIACAATPLVLPFAHEHTLAIVFLPAVLCLRRAIRSYWFAAAFATTLVAVNWLSLVQLGGATPQAIALALAATLALIGLTPRRLRLGNATPLLFPLLVAAAGLAAATHHLGQWPDVLSPVFRGPSGGDAAQTWHAELVAAGLIGVNPIAGGFRAIPLFGCAILAAVSLATLRQQRAIVPLHITPLTETATQRTLA